MDDRRDENTKPEWEANWFEAELRLKTIAQETSLPFQQQEHIISGRGRVGALSIPLLQRGLRDCFLVPPLSSPQ